MPLGFSGDGQVPGHRHRPGEHPNFLIAQRRVGGGVDRGSLGKVAPGAIEKRDHLVVGGLGEVAVTLPDREEERRHVRETHHLVGVPGEPRDDVIRADRNRQHHPARPHARGPPGHAALQDRGHRIVARHPGLALQGPDPVLRPAGGGDGAFVSETFVESHVGSGQRRHCRICGQARHHIRYLACDDPLGERNARGRGTHQTTEAAGRDWATVSLRGCSMRPVRGAGPHRKRASSGVRDRY